MILEGSLTIEYNGISFGLMVKTFLKNGMYYFFVSEKDGGKTLLGGKTLELIFTGSFCNSEGETTVDNDEIPTEIVSAIQKMLLENKQLWYY